MLPSCQLHFFHCRSLGTHWRASRSLAGSESTATTTSPLWPNAIPQASYPFTKAQTSQQPPNSQTAKQSNPKQTIKPSNKATNSTKKLPRKYTTSSGIPRILVAASSSKSLDHTYLRSFHWSSWRSAAPRRHSWGRGPRRILRGAVGAVGKGKTAKKPWKTMKKQWKVMKKQWKDIGKKIGLGKCCLVLLVFWSWVVNHQFT